jgi:hypothetical protein
MGINIGSGPSKNFYREKEIINSLLWVLVALIIQNAKNICRILFSSL